ncbi:ATP-binding cassette domain-containing protein [Bacillus atrophaeus]|uniref:ATP-binding cassette domain-containing protein n=1 Tax=Bacillus atrophaeus TaxID=1452 RepID=UPI003F5A259A
MFNIENRKKGKSRNRVYSPPLIVRYNLLLGEGPLSRKDRTEQVRGRHLSIFPVLKEMIDRKGGDLSGGQYPQLVIARALIGSPKMILIDEPRKESKCSEDTAKRFERHLIV